MAHTLTLPTTSQRTGRARAIALWSAQIVLAVQFAAGGALKITGDGAMIAMFADIGAGHWLRYVVGGLELAAAATLVIAPLAGLAALGLVGLMVGASITNVVLLDTTPAVPAALCVVSGVVACARRHDLRKLIDSVTR